MVSVEDETSSPDRPSLHDVSDSAVKQILLSMNEKDPFIIEDMDEYHLIIKADEEYRVRKELEVEVRTLSSLRRHSFILFSWKRIRIV